MNKKYVIAVGIIIVVIIIGLLIFLSRGSNNSGMFSNLFPFGNPGNETLDFDGNGEGNDLIADPSSEMSNTISKGVVRRLSDTPVTGATLFNRNGASIVRFLEKATGHIYEVNLTNGIRERISNTTIPKTEEVVWGKNGESLLLRNAQGGFIQTTLGQFSTSTGTSTSLREVMTSELSQNILFAAYPPEQDKMFMGILNTFGVEAFITNTQGLLPKLIWKYPITEWRVSWPRQDTIALTTKASADVMGSLFFLNPNNGRLQNMINAPGLLAKIDPSGNQVLFSSSQNGYIVLSIRNLSTNTSRNVPFLTFADKCAWVTQIKIVCGIPNEIMPKNTPDSWYMGNAQYTDKLWTYDVLTSETKEIVEFANAEVSGIDIEEITTSPSEDGIILIRNKRDGILWAIEFPEEQVSLSEPFATTTPDR